MRTSLATVGKRGKWKCPPPGEITAHDIRWIAYNGAAKKTNTKVGHREQKDAYNKTRARRHLTA